MRDSHTPALDSKLAGAASTMTADEAHRTAFALMEGKAPLRTPSLIRRLELAEHEFDNPAYVDAILRNIAAMDISRHYSAGDFAKVAGGGRTVPLDNVARIAADLANAYDTVAGGSLGELSVLDMRFSAFLAPFDGIAERMRDSSRYGGIMFNRRRSRRSSTEPANDYRAIARELGLIPGPDTFLMLRFCMMPALF